MGFAVEMYFDDVAERRVRRLWDRIAESCGSTLLTDIGTRPHLSLSLFDDVEPDALRAELLEFARSSVPLPVTFVPGFGGSQGNLCLGPPILRFANDVGCSGPEGVSTLTLNLTSLPQGTVFQPGETWNFQFWFRDELAGFTSNTSDGLSVVFK